MSGSFESYGVRTGSILPTEEVIDPTVDMPNGNGVYGYQGKGYGRPELLASRDEAAGGFLFFPNDVPPEFIDGLIAITGLASTQHRRKNQYAVQVIDAPEGMEMDLGYMRKLVVADRFALKFLYKTISDREYNEMPEQPLDVAELVKLFVDDERKKYGTSFGAPRLEGKFGGDGNYSREKLSFGLAVENSYHGVLSVWSRAWLVTK